MTEVTVPTLAGELRGYLGVPSGTGPWPAIVVISEVFGLTDDIRGHVDDFAAEGYLALAPDLFSWGPKVRCLQAMFRSLFRRSGPTFEHVEGARRWLARRDDCSGRVGVIGYCMGGGFALLAAPRFDFAASSVNYGQVPKDVDDLLAGSCPVVGSFGADDRALRGAAPRLEAALTRHGVEHDVKEYPGASHSFLNRHSGRLAVLDKVLGTGYREAAATDARRRILAFFDVHLR